jgi:hypothetical protein
MFILYNHLEHKKINGTLFYAFEYFIFLKKYIPSLKFLLFKISKSDFLFIINSLKNKYNIDDNCFSDILPVYKFTDIRFFNISSLIVLDIVSFEKIKPFVINSVSKIFVYSNDTHSYLNLYDNVTFYGWYDYQSFNFKTRLKLFKDIHITYLNKGNKIFFSSPSVNPFSYIGNLDINNILVKENNSIHLNLFEKISKVIYYHNGCRDTNNRLIPESFIHNVELEVIFNDNFNDSIKDRFDLIKSSPSDLFLSRDDLLISDIISHYKDFH